MNYLKALLRLLKKREVVYELVLLDEDENELAITFSEKKPRAITTRFPGGEMRRWVIDPDLTAARREGDRVFYQEVIRDS